MAGIGVLKRVKVAVFGMKYIGLIKEEIKKLEAYFLYHQNIKQE